MMTKRYAIGLLLCLLCVPVGLWGQLVQNIRGTVRDKSSGAPIESAAVTTLSGDGPAAGATTDSLGRFVIRRMPVGRYDLQVRFLGYEPVVVKEILLSAAREAYLDVEMTENVTLLNEITVRPKINKAQPLNALALGSARMFSVEETSRYAGGFDDPARLASAFAGVAGSVGNNAIVIRGNAPHFLQWRLEDVEIPNPNHFAEVTALGGGGMTAFSSQLMGHSDFFTGAFPAEYGNALSGVFDMKLRNGNDRKREHTFQLGALGIDFASEGPFRQAGRSSYVFNYRYSTMALLSSLLPANAGGVRYQDLSFKLHFPTVRAGVFSLWGVGLIDRSGQKAKTDSLQWRCESDRQEQDVRQSMGAAGVRHTMSFKNGAWLNTSLAATVSRLDYDVERLTDDALRLVPHSVVGHTNRRFIFSSVLTRKFSAAHTHKTGFSLTGLHCDLRHSNASGRRVLATVAEAAGFSALWAAHSSSSFNLSDVWRLNLGLHAQLFGLNRRYAVEPRLGVRRRIGPRHSVALSYGLHSRLEMLHYYFIRSDAGTPVHKNLDFTRAHHLVATFERTFSADHHLRLEPYVQYLFRLPVAAGRSFALLNLQRDRFITDRLENTGKGLNYGIEATFEKYISQGYYYLLTASLFDSRYRAGDGLWRNTRYNRAYVFNLLGGKEWIYGRDRQHLFQANVRLSYQGGERYTPVDRTASQQAEEVVYHETRAFSEQYPPAFVCHFTVAWKINRKDRAHEFALKVINATLTKEYSGHIYNFKTARPEPDGEVLMIPNVSYKVEF
jgi:hypothetical protein